MKIGKNLEREGEEEGGGGRKTSAKVSNKSAHFVMCFWIMMMKYVRMCEYMHDFGKKFKI